MNSIDSLLCPVQGARARYIYTPATNALHVDTPQARAAAAALHEHYAPTLHVESLRPECAAPAEPAALVLGLTESCNLRCRYCFYSGSYSTHRVHSPRQLSADVARRAIRQFLQHSPALEKTIGFHGGEPLLRSEEILKLIGFARSLDPATYFTLTTNGVYLTADVFARLLAAAPNLRITVSLDGPREAHDRWRVTVGGTGSQEIILGNLREIRRVHPALYAGALRINCVLAPPYPLAAVHEFFEREEFAGIPIQCSYAEAGELGSGSAEFRLQPSDAARAASEEIQLEQGFLDDVVGGRRPGALAGSLFGEGLERVRAVLDEPPAAAPSLPPNGCCRPGRYKVFVSADARLHICERTDDSFAIGDVDRWIDATRVGEIVSAYAGFWERNCRACWAQRFCGACEASLIHGGAAGDEAACRRLCEGVRRDLARALRHYVLCRERGGVEPTQRRVS